MTGTDEHGKKIEQAAHACGESPFEYCTRYSKLFCDLANRAQVAYSRFIRTTDDDHIKFVQACINTAKEKGDIYLSSYEGWYCIREESYVNETDAVLTEFKDPVNGVPYEKITEPAYFFRLSKYQTRIIDFLKTVEIQPESAYIDIESRLQELKDICISRSSFKWGIPFPFNEEHCVYVWFDALLNYVTGAKSLGTHTFHHIIGKDILWFHTAIYIGILVSCDLIEYFKPEKITVHGFITDELGRKMSKSVGNVVAVDELLDTYPIEAIRFYFLIRTIGYGDIHFSKKDLVNCYNGILVNQFGNLFQRIVALSIPVEEDLNKRLSTIDVKEYTCNNHIQDYFMRIQEKLSIANTSLQATKPWTVSGEERVALLMPHIESLLDLLGLFEPIIPEKCKELTRILGWDGKSLHITREKFRAFSIISH